LHHRIFRGQHPVRARLRTPQVEESPMLGNILLIVISILLCGYLFYALLKPEKF
jgi:K+-transporting ATPase KdpF subunit